MASKNLPPLCISSDSLITEIILPVDGSSFIFIIAPLPFKVYQTRSEKAETVILPQTLTIDFAGKAPLMPYDPRYKLPEQLESLYAVYSHFPPQYLTTVKENLQLDSGSAMDQ